MVRSTFTANFEGLILLLPVGANAEGAHRIGQVSGPTLEVSARCVPYMRPYCQSQLLATTINSLQPGQGQPPSGFPKGWADLFKDHPAYRIVSWEPCHIIK